MKDPFHPVLAAEQMFIDERGPFGVSRGMKTLLGLDVAELILVVKFFPESADHRRNIAASIRTNLQFASAEPG